MHDTHVEILKRADGLLCFMADHGKIDEAHLDLLWAAGRGQPDAQASKRSFADSIGQEGGSEGGGGVHETPNFAKQQQQKELRRH